MTASSLFPEHGPKGDNQTWSIEVNVVRKGNFTRSGLDLVDEVEMFRGDENPLVMKQVYTHRFQCKYDLERYPFDTQHNWFPF